MALPWWELITASAVSLHAKLSYAGRETMTFYVFFWILCAVLAANVVVVFVAITKAYHNEGRCSFSELGNRHKRVAR